MSYNKVFLVVDDMVGMRRILTNSLNQIGVANVITATNGVEAWRVLQSQPIDVVISDWNMPVMTGLELLRKIRADTKYAKLPVLMMTAETERHQARLAIEAGVSEYMIKPFNVAALELKIKKIIGNPLPQGLTVIRQAPTVLRSTVPQPVSSTPGAAAQAAQNANAEKASILVVDDVPENLDILVNLLGDTYHVKVASSGEKALKIMNSAKPPDLVLLDVMMQEMDGFEVCRQFKANPATADIPVIFLTAMSETTDVTRGFALGAVDFVTKPAEPPILRARIETHLKLRRSYAELKRNRLELIEKNAVLEDNLRLKDEVERIAQHDLKNPVAGIISFSSSLLEDATVSESHKEIIKYIEQSAYSVLNMVNLSSDMYKMEQGSYDFSAATVHLTQLLNRILTEMKSEISSRLLTVQFQTRGTDVPDLANMQIQGDELLCYSMFNNLIKNAIEAAPAISILQFNIEPDQGQTTIHITNSGAVPREVRDTFFEKFATHGKLGGTGLGTFSAKLIATIQHGAIAMDTSDERNSTTVSVSLPNRG